MRPQGEKAGEGLQSLPDAEALRSLTLEAWKRSQEWQAGLNAWMLLPDPKPYATPSKVVWERHGARLLDFGGPQEGVAVFFVPSLINRHYILDLAPSQSLVAFLRDAGMRVFVLDWGEPQKDTLACDTAAYVTRILAPACESVGRPLILAGYCMGGLLAMAGAQLLPSQVRGLALLATPWSFAPEIGGYAALPEHAWRDVGEWISRQPRFPATLLNSWFQSIDPLRQWRKLRRLALTPIDSPERERFARLERWVWDGVDLATPVALEWLSDWPRRDALARGLWQIGGRAVTPAALDVPVLAAIPSEDTIVPAASATALLPLLRDPTVLRPPAGHVGMVVGHKARASLWEPLAQWCGKIAAAQ
ncbi:MAG: alpha/beta fold hydrolase [Alphaproteobacteria bacterium]|nr:alpha/beta fold hydrolase [Alphaproteobacteria bacterium]